MTDTDIMNYLNKCYQNHTFNIINRLEVVNFNNKKEVLIDNKETHIWFQQMMNTELMNKNLVLSADEALLEEISNKVVSYLTK